MKKCPHCGKEIKAGIKEKFLNKLRRLLFMRIAVYFIALSVFVLLCFYLIIINWGKDWNVVTSLLSLITALIAVWAVIQSNYNSRFCTGADLLIRLEERFITKEMKEKRKKAAEAILKGHYKENNVATILDFFSVIAILAYRSTLDKEMVWRTFSAWLIPYYYSLEDYIEKERKEKNDQKLYESLSKLYYELTTLETKASLDKLTGEKEIEKFYKDEISECS